MQIHAINTQLKTLLRECGGKLIERWPQLDRFAQQHAPPTRFTHLRTQIAELRQAGADAAGRTAERDGLRSLVYALGGAGYLDAGLGIRFGAKVLMPPRMPTPAGAAELMRRPAGRRSCSATAEARLNKLLHADPQATPAADPGEVYREAVCCGVPLLYSCCQLFEGS